VHYPTYRFVSQDIFYLFQKFHVRRITFVVGPVMIIELFTGAWLTFKLQPQILPALNFALLVLTWISTTVFSIPTHEKLLQHYQPSLVNYLIKTNWFRTIFWSLRSILLIYLTFISFKDF
jgi:hypothetical protein